MRRGELLVMAILRMLLLVSVAFIATVVLARGRWEAQFRYGNHTWILGLDRAPVWNPPRLPSYQEFSKTFDDLPKLGRGQRIIRKLKWDWMLFDLLLYLWVVTATYGIVYWLVRGSRRDPVLHCSLSIGMAMTVSVGIGFVIWPAAFFFRLLGVVAGSVIASQTYRAESAGPIGAHRNAQSRLL